MFFCLAFLTHLLRLEEHELSCQIGRALVLESEFFLMTKPGIEEKSLFAFWVVVGLRVYFKFLPQLL